MNNVNKFTASEINKLQRDIEKIAREAKWEYPVAMTTVAGTGATTVVQLKEVGQPTVMKHASTKDDANAKFVFKAQLKTYEFINRNGETKKIRIPDMEGMTTAELYKLAADMITFTESLRKFVNMQTMANEEVIKACPEGVGVVLADKLLGLPGINALTELALKDAWSRSQSTQAFTTFMQNHNADRAVVELKDKFIAASAEQYAEACRGIAANLEKFGNARVDRAIPTTGITATIVNDGSVSIAEVSSIREPKKSLKTIL